MNKKLEPEFRFPEFENKEPWEIKRLIEIASSVTDKNRKNIHSRVLTNSAEHGVVDQQDFFDKQIANSENLNAYYIVKKGDFVYNPRVSKHAPVGPISKNKIGDGLMSPLYSIFRFNSSETEFFEFFFKTTIWHKYLLNKAKQGARHDRMGISSSDLKNMPLPYPSPAEQKKIADCLSSLDELIQAERERLEALQAHKKGLMQQLFPAKGETIPKLRFSKEGSWVNISLPDVVFFQEGPGIMAVDFRSEGVPLIRLSGVGGPIVTLDGCNFLNPKKVKEKWDHFRLVPNDLIISTSATFGLSSLVTEAVAGSIFYTGLIRFRPINEKLDRGYLKEFLVSPPFERQVKSAAVGGGIKHFGPTHLKKMEIFLPPIEEQQKISEFLSSINKEIELLIEKIKFLKSHKKGLFQQLFPQLES